MAGSLRTHPLVERIIYYGSRVQAWWHRATVRGLAIRAVVWASGLAAGLLALPPGLVLLAAVPLVAVWMLLPAGMPRGSAPSVAAVAVVVALTFRLIADPPSEPLLLVTAIAALLYLHHTAAALAAQVRTDAVVPAALLRHWAKRAVAVIAASAGLGLLVQLLPAPVWPATGQLALGIAAAVGVTATLVWLLRRPVPGDGQPGRSARALRASRNTPAPPR